MPEQTTFCFDADELRTLHNCIIIHAFITCIFAIGYILSLQKRILDTFGTSTSFELAMEDYVVQFGLVFCGLIILDLLSKCDTLQATVAQKQETI